MHKIVIDIETIPSQDEAIKLALQQPILERAEEDRKEIGPPSNWKDAEKISEWWQTTGNAKRDAIFFAAEQAADEAWRQTALDGAHGNVAVVCVKVEDDTAIQLYDGGFSYREPGYEAWLLNETNKTLRRICGHHLGQQLIGHNRSFDRTFLRQRGIVLGVQMHDLITAPAKPWEELHLDTMTMWTGDPHKRCKLEKLCQIFGLQLKGEEIGEEIDGSMVWDYVQRGEIAKVAAYCAGDVDRTWAAYKRLTLMDRPPVVSYTPSGLRERAQAEAAKAAA
jgi:hypothetical protein